MTIHLEAAGVTIHEGDCLDVMRSLPADSVDSVVTDPPYGLAALSAGQIAETLTAWIAGDREHIPSGSGFMGKAWDAFVPPVAVWDEALRVLKPGGHVVAFAGSRTMDLMALGLRLAGFEIRDSVAWLYGSGFPKSRNVTAEMAEYETHGPRIPERPDRPIDPTLYEVTGYLRNARDAAGWTNARIDQLFGTNGMAGHWTSRGTQPACPSVRQWEVLKTAIGFGDDVDDLVTALAATERPDDWGAGADVGDGARFLGTLGPDRSGTPPTGWGTALKPAFEPVVLARKPLIGTVGQNVLQYGTGALNIDGLRAPTTDSEREKMAAGAAAFVRMAERDGETRPDGTLKKPAVVYGTYGVNTNPPSTLGRWPANVILDEHQAAALDAQSGVSRSAAGPVTYSQRSGAIAAPASTQGDVTRREVIVDGYGDEGGASRFFYTAKAGTAERPNVDGITHPTVKPVDLMRWLCRLVTPRGGTVLEPFAGSGTTVEAAVLEGFACVAIEREAAYLPLIMQRVSKPHAVGLDLGDWVDDSEPTPPTGRRRPASPSPVVELPLQVDPEPTPFDFGDWDGGAA